MVETPVQSGLMRTPIHRRLISGCYAMTTLHPAYFPPVRLIERFGESLQVGGQGGSEDEDDPTSQAALSAVNRGWAST